MHSFSNILLWYWGDPVFGYLHKQVLLKRYNSFYLSVQFFCCLTIALPSSFFFRYHSKEPSSICKGIIDNYYHSIYHSFFINHKKYFFYLTDFLLLFKKFLYIHPFLEYIFKISIYIRINSKKYTNFFNFFSSPCSIFKSNVVII